MAADIRAQVVGVGGYVPERVLTNADLEKLVDTNDEWITTRTGIRQRHIAEPGTPLSDLALPACQQALERANLQASDIDGIIVATITGDHVMPTTANRLQHLLGINGAWAFDVANACNGFVVAITTGAGLIEAGRAKRLLIVGGDVMSSVINYKDRNTCILFGDGAGAVVLEAGASDGPGVMSWAMHSEGEFGPMLSVPASGSAMPMTPDALAADKQYLQQDGSGVFKHAVRRMSQVATEVLDKLGLTGDDIDLLVPHQANRRILEPTARRLGLPLDRVVINIASKANTTGGTIPLALADAFADGRLTDGSRIMLAAFGGGFSWGACYLTWGRG